MVVDDAIQRLERGVEEILLLGELKDKLKSGRALRIKAGFEQRVGVHFVFCAVAFWLLECKGSVCFGCLHDALALERQVRNFHFRQVAYEGSADLGSS